MLASPARPGAYAPEERLRGQRLMVWDGVFSQILSTLTGTSILTAFALSFGANDAQLGLLAAIPALAQIAYIPAIGVLAARPDRRGITVSWALAARLLWFGAGVLALARLPAPVALGLCFAIVAAYTGLATISGAAWQTWMRELVDPETLASYLGGRMAIVSAVGFASALIVGAALWETGGMGPARHVDFAALFVVAGLAGMASTLTLARAPSRLVAAPRGARVDPFLSPLKNANFRRALAFLIAWSFASNLAGPFFVVFLLTRAHWSLAAVTSLAAVALAANVAGYTIWSPLADRFGSRSVLSLGACLSAMGLVVFAFLPAVGTSTTALATVLLAVVFQSLAGFSNAAMDIGSTALTMRLSPNADSGPYLAAASLAKAIGAAGGSILAGAFLASFSGGIHTVAFLGTSPVPLGPPFSRFDGYTLLAAVSGLGALWACRLLDRIEEERPFQTAAVLDAMRRTGGSQPGTFGVVLRWTANSAAFLGTLAWPIGRAVAWRPLGSVRASWNGQATPPLKRVATAPSPALRSR